MYLQRIKPKRDQRFFTVLFAAAQFALVFSILIERYAVHNLPGWVPIDFIAGLLAGFSLVGNLAFLVHFNHQHRSGGK